MKIFNVALKNGVEGNSNTITRKIVANSSYEAEKKIKEEYGTRLNNEKRIDCIKILQMIETDLPILTNAEINQAVSMFSNSQNPVLEFQKMKAGV